MHDQEMPPAANDLETLPRHELLRHAVFEIDHFCEGCGYNLFRQTITRDERLGLMLCRCPECGRFAPANTAATASSVWMRRLATMLITSSILGFLAYVGVTILILWGLQSLHLESQRDHQYQYSSWDFGELLFLHGGSMLACFLLGAAFALVMWHARAIWQYTAVLVPWMSGVLTYLSNWDSAIFIYVLIQSLAVGVGVLFGRPVARLVLSLLIPPQARQLFTYLWRVDNKRPPAASMSAARGG